MAGNRSKAPLVLTPPPWKSWKRTSRHGRAIRFMETYCRSPKGVGHGKPMKLGGFQKEWLEEALADGVESAAKAYPRGNGKSTFSAGFACWGGFDDDATGSPNVPIVATTVGQAKRSIYDTVLSMVKAEPEMANRSSVFTAWGSEHITVAYNEGSIYPVANNVDVLQGLDPSLAIMDEVGFQPIDSWSSLVLAAGKRDRSLTVGLGTPGLDRDNALFHLRSQVMEGAEMPGFVFREYAADEGCDVDDREQWRKANPAIGAGFLRESALVTARGMVPEAHFRIFRLGQWVDGTDSWLGADGRKTWERLRRKVKPEKGAPTWVGIDVGIKRDSTAVCIVQFLPDGHLAAWVRLWVPTKDEPVDVTDVMHHLRQLRDQYKVGGISFDPKFFDVPAKMLHDEGLPMVEVPQSPERMTPIIMDLYDRIQRGEIHHDGDPAFAQQVLNAVPRYSERGFTLQKSKSRGRIDACIALSLAIDRAVNRAKPRPALFVG